MTADEILAGLRVLMHYYAVKGEPHALNDIQMSVYLDGLAPFSAPEFEAASRQWMRTSKWFPSLSELLGLMMRPVASPTEQGYLALAAVEGAIRRFGAYRPVRFEDPAIGETVQRVFGGWPEACSYDFDSPGWHGRRQQFLALYQAIASRTPSSSPVLRGLHDDQRPALIPHVEGLPEPRLLSESSDETQLSKDEARALLESVKRRLPRAPLKK